MDLVSNIISSVQHRFSEITYCALRAFWCAHNNSLTSLLSISGILWVVQIQLCSRQVPPSGLHHRRPSAVLQHRQIEQPIKWWDLPVGYEQQRADQIKAAAVSDAGHPQDTSGCNREKQGCREETVPSEKMKIRHPGGDKLS